MKNEVRKEYLLTRESIDEISEEFSSALTEAECDRKDVLRLRLSLEEILETWLSSLSSAPVVYTITEKAGRRSIRICVRGDEIDENDEIKNYTLSSRLLSQAGLSIIKSYRKGENVLSVYFGKKKKTGQIPRLAAAIVLAVVLGLLERLLPSSIREVTTEVMDPLFNMILGLLSLISSPMIFLSVSWGIFNIGDISTMGRVGKKVIKGIVVTTIVLSVVTASTMMWFFPHSFSNGGVSLSGLVDIYNIILDIVPGDIVSPFLNGNTLQIIFLGVAVGVALLVLGDRVSAAAAVIEQFNEVVNLMMSAVSSLVPFFVFLSIFSLMGSDFSGDILSVFKVIVLTFVFTILLVLGFVLFVSVRYRVKLSLLIGKFLPTYIIGLTTASSAAAFATNMETCEKKLGIDTTLSHFAVPLGQVIFKPGALIGFTLVCLSMAGIYSIPVTPAWIMTMIIVVALLSMAAPPIPGGALTCYTVMFSQLSIPLEAVAIAVAVNSILDFLMTSANLSCLQAESVIVAGRLDMLDKSVLSK